MRESRGLRSRRSSQVSPPGRLRDADPIPAYAETKKGRDRSRPSSVRVYVAVAESPDIGAALAARYVEPVRQTSSGEEILASVREWFGSTMKVGAAAKRLHIHPNTLRYRLKRYAELTGSDLGETEQAVAAWLALQNDLISR